MKKRGHINPKVWKVPELLNLRILNLKFLPKIHMSSPICSHLTFALRVRETCGKKQKDTAFSEFLEAR